MRYSGLRRIPTGELIRILNETEPDAETIEEIEDELDLRELDEPHEDSPSLDAPWWENR